MSLFPELTTKEKAEQRGVICKGCENYIKLTGQCKLCLCFTKFKTMLENETCSDKTNPKW